MSNISGMNVENLADLFHFYAESRLGSRNIINAFIDRFSHVNEGEIMDEQSNVKVIFALNICGTDDEHIRLHLDQLSKSQDLSKLSYDDLFVVDRILSNLKGDEYQHLRQNVASFLKK